jgi:cytidylate kinase
VVADVNGTKVLIDNCDVTESLNGEKVGETASKVSAIPEVRAALMAPQRAFGTGTAKGLVAEGRDCGTVVFPQADVKIFLTASLDARAQRRTSETAGASVQESQSKIQTRDHADSSRKVAPMAKAPDAVEIDTSHLSVAEVVDKILELIRQKNGGKTP